MSAILALRTDRPKLKYSYKDVVALLPQEYRKQIEANEEKNREIGHQLLLWCLTQSTHFVAPSVANVLQFLIARTYGYSKQGELISINHLIAGIFSSSTGASVVAPAVKDKTTAHKALKILEGAGLVEKVRITVNGADVISFIRVLPDAILSLIMTETDYKMLRLSKKHKQQSDTTDDSEDDFLVKKAFSRLSEKSDSRVSEKSDTEYINNKEDKKKISCSVPRNVVRVSRVRKNEIDCKPRFDKAKDAVAEAVARVTEKREAKVRRAARAAGFISLSDLNATWQSVMVSAFGSCTMSGMTHKEYGIFKRIAKTHTLSCSWKEFLEWVVQNWSQINNESKEIARYKRSQGDWSLKDDQRIFLGSESPDLFMMAKNFSKLVKRFSQHTLSGRKVSVAESEEVEKLRKEVQVAKHEAAVQKHLNKKLLNARVTPTASKQEKTVPRIIRNPEDDDFFDKADASLPEWK